MTLRTADIDPSYENVRATCPSCGRRNIFNRVSDLKTVDAIAGMDVDCSFCTARFRLISDRINVPHEALLFDCEELLAEKRYMQCVLSTAQAYEIFFSHYFRVQGLYRPHARQDEPNLPHLNEVSAKLYSALKKMTFSPMRSLFLVSVTGSFSPVSLTETELWLDTLPARGYDKPPREAVERVLDPKLKAPLLGLYDTRVGTLRNDVVHKDAYRPTRTEAQGLLDEAKQVLLPLTTLLKLKGSASWYLNAAGR